MELHDESNSFEYAASFSIALFRKLLASLENVYLDNAQLYYQLGNKTVQEDDVKAISKKPVVSYKDICVDYELSIQKEIKYKSYLYSLLSDNSSRGKLVSLAAYAVLGHTRIKLPYYIDNALSLRFELLKQSDVSFEGDKRLLHAVQSKWKTDVFSLYKYNINNNEFKTYTIGEELFRRFYSPSYECTTDFGKICVEKDDVVLDCGAAFGDVSLQFAQSTGENGKVICFEPYPLFIEVFQANLAMNSNLAKTITLIEKAVWDKSNEVLSFIEGGGGSRIDQRNKCERKIGTTKIDDTVKSLSLPKVDFIKMDIEGAELNALLGAKNTIFAFKPKLAICLYHSPKDFYEIPSLIHSWGLNYKFYINHNYMNQWETVLYAVSN